MRHGTRAAGALSRRPLVWLVITVALAACEPAAPAAAPASPTAAARAPAAPTAPLAASTATTAAPTATTAAPAPPVASGIVQIAVRDNVFEPPFVEVRAGTLVRWHNQGRDDHDVVAEDSSFESPVLRPGEAYERVFDSPGSFPYLCDLHDNMTATIVVR